MNNNTFVFCISFMRAKKNIYGEEETSCFLKKKKKIFVLIKINSILFYICNIFIYLLCLFVWSNVDAEMNE